MIRKRVHVGMRLDAGLGFWFPARTRVPDARQRLRAYRTAQESGEPGGPELISVGSLALAYRATDFF
jgi:hypothetical protein